MEGIKDKVVVITGASSGIGEATTTMLAERGAKVVLGARGLARRNPIGMKVAVIESGYQVAGVGKRWHPSIPTRAFI